MPDATGVTIPIGTALPTRRSPPLSFRDPTAECVIALDSGSPD